ncbi:MAG: PBP1A family penicillin-binding protein [Acidobacteriota bacterium]
MTRKIRRPPTRRRWRKPLLVAAALCLAALAWLVWPFWQLSEQFGAARGRQPSRLYGKPTVVAPGVTMTAEALASELAAMGYAAAPSPDGLGAGTYHRRGDIVELFRRRFPSPRGPVGLDRVRVDFRGGKVARLVRDGKELRGIWLDPPLVASYYGPDLEDRRPVTLDELPEPLILSVLAAEDAGFLEHGGVSLRGILRAAWINFRAKEVRQGGSTLTQQLVKNLYLSHERSWARKAQEAMLAVILELRYEKRAILEAYLNEIYWGRSGRVNLMGVGAASWAYFGKQPAQLTLAESATLAGMIQAPASLSPLSRPEASKGRRDFVLQRLGELGWMTEEVVAAAQGRPVVAAATRITARSAPYFADAMAEEARRRFGIETLDDAGYVLHSTLDARDQAHAEAAVAWGLDALEKGWEKGRERATPLQAALISVDPDDGGIRAYVGGRDYGKSQFDRVTRARRQAGSVFKPVVYAAAFERRTANPATFLEDASYTVRRAGQTWSPRNSDGKFHGWVTARTALEKSYNVPTARLAVDMGLDSVVDMAERLGVRRKLDPYPALALGAMEVSPLEMATVYTTLAAGGLRSELHGLVAAFDSGGRELPGADLDKPERVLEEDVAFVVTKVLQGVLDRGTARGAREQGLRDPLAGKTGTTNDRRDSWFGGYSPDRATLVWVGYDDNATTRLSGARAALPIWSRFTYKTRPTGGYRDFRQPEGVVAAWIDPRTGGLAHSECSELEREFFLRDFVPEPFCADDDRRWRRKLERRDETRELHPFRRWLRMLRGKDRGTL